MAKAYSYVVSTKRLTMVGGIQDYRTIGARERYREEGFVQSKIIVWPCHFNDYFQQCTELSLTLNMLSTQKYKLTLNLSRGHLSHNGKMFCSNKRRICFGYLGVITVMCALGFINLSSNLICVESFCVHLIVFILPGQVEENTEATTGHPVILQA